MLNLENVKAKYCMDDFASKKLNNVIHSAKAHGRKFNKGDKSNYALGMYIAKANSTLGSSVQIAETTPPGASNPTFGINLSARGTVSVPEAKALIQKLQQAIGIIKKAPKASGDKTNPY